MQKSALVFALLGSLSLSAQSFEVGVFAGRQAYKSPSTGDSFSSTSASSDSKTVLGLRLGYALLDLGPALLQVTAGFQPETTTTVTTTETQNILHTVTVNKADYKSSHYALGAMANFKAMVAVGAGVEYRFESLKGYDKTTTYARPWVRATLGMAFPTLMVKPFIGLEAAFPLTSKSVDNNSNTEDALKAMAPKSQIGLYGGIRF